MIAHSTRFLQVSDANDITVRVIMHPFSVRISAHLEVPLEERGYSQRMLKSRMLWYPLSTHFLLDKSFRSMYLSKTFGRILTDNTAVQMIMASCDKYGEFLATTAAKTIQRFWRGWWSRKIHNLSRKKMHMELGLMPPKTIHDTFPGGFMYTLCQERYYRFASSYHDQ